MIQIRKSSAPSKEIGEKYIYIISRSGNDIRALKGKPAEFGFISTIGNVSTHGGLKILFNIPYDPGLKNSGRVGQIMNGRKKEIEQWVNFNLDMSA